MKIWKYFFFSISWIFAKEVKIAQRFSCLQTRHRIFIFIFSQQKRRENIIPPEQTDKTADIAFGISIDLLVCVSLFELGTQDEEQIFISCIFLH